MTLRPKKPCRNKLCKAITNDKTGYCPECQPMVKQREKAVRQEYNTRRDPKVKQWLNSARYKNARLNFLARHPLCARTSTKERPVIATILDHKTPHRGDYALFWDQSNWQGLSKQAHDRKTASEDQGFGNPKKG